MRKQYLRIKAHKTGSHNHSDSPRAHLTEIKRAERSAARPKRALPTGRGSSRPEKRVQLTGVHRSDLPGHDADVGVRFYQADAAVRLGRRLGLVVPPAGGYGRADVHLVVLPGPSQFPFCPA